MYSQQVRVFLMTSLLTNNASMAALQTLRTINADLQDSQDNVSSGLRVQKAADNAAYWSIATTMRSDNMALSAVSDALGLGAAKVDTAYTAMESAIDVVSDIKAKLVAATEDGVDKGKVQDEITELQKQLKSIAESASFSGENWVAGANGTVSVVSSFVRGSAGGIKVTTTDYVLDAGTLGNVLFGMNADGSIDTDSGILGTDIVGSFGAVNITMGSIYDLDIRNYTTGDVQVVLQGIELVMGALTTAGSQLGSMSTRIDLQENFVSTLKDSITSGVGRLVDTDMEEESSRLQALQTQQQLAIQSLSIANSSTQNVLSLYRS
jgi:flagellin